MNATVNGVVSGLQSGDAVTLIEIVWKSGAETEAQAQVAGRGVDLTTAEDIAAFQAAGYALSDAELVAGQTYTPAVRVTESREGSGAFVGPWTNGSAFTTSAVSIAAAQGDTTVTISWTPGTGALSSRIRYGTSTGVYGTDINPAVSPQQITGLTNGQTIYYQVGTTTAGGVAWSAELTTSANASPVFSSQPTVQSVTATTAVIAFGTSDAETDHYRLDYSTDNGSTWTTGAVADQTPGAGKTVTIATLTAGTSYTVKLRLHPLTGTLADVVSNSVTALTLPAAPTISVVAGNAQNVITITPVTGAASYNLYWTSNGVDPTTGSTKITGAVSPYTHDSPPLTNGLTYKYKCEAVNASGTSALGAVASGVPNANVFNLDLNTTTFPDAQLSTLFYETASMGSSTDGVEATASGVNIKTITSTDKAVVCMKTPIDLTASGTYRMRLKVSSGVAWIGLFSFGTTPALAASWPGDGSPTLISTYNIASSTVFSARQTNGTVNQAYGAHTPSFNVEYDYTFTIDATNITFTVTRVSDSTVMATRTYAKSTIYAYAAGSVYFAVGKYDNYGTTATSVLTQAQRS